MRIKKIRLKNYRNYSNLEVEFNNIINIIIGDNAQGKTNLLESIYVLAVTKSFLSISDKNLIKFNGKFSVIEGLLETKNSVDKLEIIFNGNGKNVRINGKEIKKLSDYISKMNVVIFSSDSIRMIKESPSTRRKYFNTQISQINRRYLKLLSDYNLVLRQRNEFLKIINVNKKNDMDYLDILNDKYVDLSLDLCKYRRKYISNINNYIGNIFEEITGLGGLKINYNSNVLYDLDKDKMIKKMRDNLNKDIMYRITLIGPNRDDFYFELDGKDLSVFGSQGQIRSAILSLKLSEVLLFSNETGDSPIVLLDDMFSELDINKRNNIIKYLDKNIQTIITTTDVDNINEEIRKNSNVYVIKNGKLFPGK